RRPDRDAPPAPSRVVRVREARSAAAGCRRGRQRQRDLSDRSSLAPAGRSHVFATWVDGAVVGARLDAPAALSGPQGAEYRRDEMGLSTSVPLNTMLVDLDESLRGLLR